MANFQIDRESSIPLYEQVKTLLRRHILVNELPPLTLLPTEDQLVRQLGVSKATVIKALNELASEGIIQRIQGKGTLVASPRIHFPLKSPNGFSAIMAEQKLKVHSVLISQRVISGERREQTVFGTDPAVQDGFIEFRRLRFVNGHPVVLLTSIVPRHLGEELQRFNLEDASFYRLFEQITGLPIIRSEETLEIGQVNQEDARLLRVPEHSSHFLLRGISYREGDVPLETTESIFHANFFRFQIDMKQVVVKQPAFSLTAEDDVMRSLRPPSR